MFYRFLDETLFPQPCLEVCPQHGSHSDGLQSVYVRRYSLFWVLESLKKCFSLISPPLLSPFFCTG